MLRPWVSDKLFKPFNAKNGRILLAFKKFPFSPVKLWYFLGESIAVVIAIHSRTGLWCEKAACLYCSEHGGYCCSTKETPIIKYREGLWEIPKNRPKSSFFFFFFSTRVILLFFSTERSLLPLHIKVKSHCFSQAATRLDWTDLV